MTTFVFGRPTTWLLVLWSGYIATWATVSGSGPAIVAAWWLAGVALVQAIAHYVARPKADSGQSSEAMHVLTGWRLGDAVQDWESEGGTIG